MEQKRTNMRILFPSDLSIDTDAEGNPSLILSIGGMAMTDLFMSDCSRFEADPEIDHGVPDDFARAMSVINAHLKEWAKNEADPVKRLAREFSIRAREYLSMDEMEEVIKRNRTEEVPLVCHTHDFCDANMIMDAAMEKLGLRSKNEDVTNQLWSAAWDLAKKTEFIHG